MVRRDVCSSLKPFAASRFSQDASGFRPGDSGDRDPLVTVPWPIRAVIPHIDLSKQVEHNPGILNQTQPRSRANIVRRRACRNKQPLLAWGLRLDFPELSFNRLIDTIPNAALVVDPHGRIALANKLAYEVFGYGVGELDMKPIDILVPEPNSSPTYAPSRIVLQPPDFTPCGLSQRPFWATEGRQPLPGRHLAEPNRSQRCLAHPVHRLRHHREKASRGSARRERGARYRGLFENMVEGFALCQMIVEDGRPVDWIYLEVNPAFESLTGLEGISGKRATEAIPGIRQSDPELFEIYGRVAETAKPERFEMYVEALEMWFDISVYSPQHGQFVAIFDVITERKQAAEALSLFRELIDQSNDAIEVVDPESFRFVDVNQRACRETGYSHEEYLSLTVADIDPSMASADLGGIRQELLESGSMIHEGLHRRKDGSTYPVEVGLSYVELDKAYIVSVARDVSERKELHERLQLFRSLIDQSNDAIEVIDPHTFRVLDASQGTWESLGYARDEYLGMSVFDINPNLNQDQVHALNERLRETGAVYFEGERHRKDGSTFPVEVSLSRVKLDREYFVSVARDTTERLQRNRELETIAQVGAALRVARGLDEMRPIILQELLSILEAEGALLATPNGEPGGAVIDLGAGVWTGLTGRRLASGETILGFVIQSAEAYVSNRLLEESPDPRSASLLQLPAVATIPLSARGEVVGALAVGRSKAFTSEDVRLLTSIADMVANAVRRVTLREQTERDALQLARAYELDDFRLVGGAGLEGPRNRGPHAASNGTDTASRPGLRHVGRKPRPHSPRRVAA